MTIGNWQQLRAIVWEWVESYKIRVQSCVVHIFKIVVLSGWKKKHHFEWHRNRNLIDLSRLLVFSQTKKNNTCVEMSILFKLWIIKKNALKSQLNERMSKYCYEIMLIESTLFEELWKYLSKHQKLQRNLFIIHRSHGYIFIQVNSVKWLKRVH